MRIGEYKEIAKERLRGQWGINVGMIFLNSLLVMAIGRVSEMLNQGFVQGVIALLLNVFIIFAFGFAMYYVALFVVRGGRADIGQLFVVFQQKYYVPMLVINIVSTIVQYLVGLVIFIPVILQGGLAVYFAFVIGSGANSAQLLPLLGTAGFALLFLATFAIFLLVTSIISGLFRFAVYLKFDYPELAPMECIKKAWDMIKDRWGQFILLQLSFIGWYIVGALLLVVGLLWAVAYANTANAAFYDEALKEKAELI
ncbi:hypothetical protein NRIC_07710 [Enterococcus florum]|uniref:DUF975 domain-containing protein n=1 Tax=Enterococcus florum TaxID=2480627 RepID=A0A4P5P5B8_9ENTE|nr:DUF975 family protein [Enterococcus florum]GCF92880.1 hypothetical protein NRIC_07710 [Enterococcus florum]